MVETGLSDLKRQRGTENRFATLRCNHSPGGKRSTVADFINRVDDRNAGVSGPQKIGLLRVNYALLNHGVLCGAHRLRKHLSAKYPSIVGLWCDPSI